MPRVRTVSLDGMALNISPLSYDEAEQYILDGRKMLESDPKPTNEEWVKRTIDSVVLAINKAPGNGADRWTSERVRKELDMVYVGVLYEEFMEMSGLKAADKGEAKAATTSTSSQSAAA